jgi:predicted permease
VARRPFIERALRGLVRLLPEDFRLEFGGSIRADLADRRRAGDRAGLLRRDLPSLLAALVREHLGALKQDVTYAARMMRRTPGFTAMAVLMLALGTGVNVAMFSVIDAVMLRSPFREPERIVRLFVGEGRQRTSAVPPPRFAELAAQPGPFESVAAAWGGTHIVTGAAEPYRPDVECVSASMHAVLGTPPLLGRWFAADDDRPDAPATIVLSSDLWHRLGGSGSVVGTTLTVNQTPTTVIGVMPPDFAGPYSRADTGAWVPLNRPIAGGGSTGCANLRFVSVFARMGPGVSMDAARARLPGFTLLSHQDEVVGSYRTALLALTGAVICVLLIACFNVGGLQMERMLAREREMSVRTALGASRGRLIRQTLTENLLLALVGAVAGIAAAWLTLQTIVSLLPPNLPQLNGIRINPRVLAVGLAAGAGTGLLAGLLPVAMTRGLTPGRSLGGGARATGRHGRWTRRGLVLAEVALSMVVLIGAGLMVRTFLNIRPDRPGFDAANKVVLSVSLPGASPETSERFFTTVLDRLRGRPGIHELAGARNLPPLFGIVSTVPVAVNEQPVTTYFNIVTAGYLESMAIPVIAGRVFSANDTKGTVPVAVVNEELARRLGTNGQVIGRQIAIGEPARPNDPPRRLLQVVGIVGNTRAWLRDAIPRTEIYVAFAQNPSNVMQLIARSDGRGQHAAAVEMRAAVRALRPDLVLNETFAMTDRLDRTVQFWRFGAWLLGVFAALAVLLAAIGLMTTIGWWVRQRTREIGVRVAMGATRGTIVALVLRQGLLLAGIGIAAGCAAASGVTRFLASWLYGVTPLDGPTFTASAAVMLVIAVVAVIAPVRRAASVDPVVALKIDT